MTRCTNPCECDTCLRARVQLDWHAREGALRAMKQTHRVVQDVEHVAELLELLLKRIGQDGYTRENREFLEYAARYLRKHAVPNAEDANASTHPARFQPPRKEVSA